MSPAENTKATVIPTLRYRDAPAAIEWLCATFGFEKHLAYAKAKAAGVEILIEIRDEDYGGRDFSCRDLEGHLWSLGTYDPWE